MNETIADANTQQNNSVKPKRRSRAVLKWEICRRRSVTAGVLPLDDQS
ncbi:MAG: hypothetical protein R3C53_27685 [Pirellulaceae bacterium]